MKIQLTVLLSSLLILSLSADVYCPDPYKYNVFALSWLGEFCTENTCNAEFDEWDQTSFTIHGFWPSPNTRNHPYHKYSLCNSRENIQNCYGPLSFDALGYDYLMSNQTGLQEDLDKYWPEAKQGKDNGAFYEHEWDKHGACYLQHMINYNRKAYEQDRIAFSEEIFKAYFRSTIEKVKELNLKFKSGDRFDGKDSFASRLGLGESEFTYECYDDKEIDELRIFYSVSSRPGQEEITTVEYRNNECRSKKEGNAFTFH